MSESAIRPSSLATSGLYIFSALLILWPPVDLLSTAWPLHLGTLEYRYGLMGLLAGFLHTPTLGLVIAMAAAYAMRHLTLLRVLSFLCLLGALGLLAVLVMFPLDVLQMKAVTAPEAHASMKVGAIIAELKHFSGMVALVLLGLGGWRTAGRGSAREKPGERRRKSSESGGRTSDLAVKPERTRQEPGGE